MVKPNIPKLLHKLYFETARQKIVEVLFRYPDKEFSLSELAKEAGVAKANIGEILNDFLKAGLIEVKKLSKIWRIKANQKSPLYIKNKIVSNMNYVYQSGLVEFLNEKFSNPKAIILFGSYRRGEDISDSDIDIAVESDEVKDYESGSLKELEDIEKDIGRKIQIHLFNRKNVDINVFNNIANGIILSGFLEVKI
jgi:predicted nucleotidyltransferase